MFQFIRYLLFPVSLLYALVLKIRHSLFDKKILKSIEYDLPLIGIGNLNVGGSGKTPMVEYLIELLDKEGYQLATLSRGYRRRSSGFKMADADSTALDIGDEPQQIHLKYPQVKVSVGEDRVLAIPDILVEAPEVNCILLDDVFQHRYLAPQINILLTNYDQPFSQDWYLPTGNLRDLKSAAQRADFIIVGKCPENLNAKEQAVLRQELKSMPQQQLFFSYIQYQTPYSIFDHSNDWEWTKNQKILLVAGIAKAHHLKKHLQEHDPDLKTMLFSDHHYFTKKEIKKIARKFQDLKGENKIIITTEKDATRLLLHRALLVELKLPIYCLPIKMKFLQDEKQFQNQLLNKLQTIS